MTTPNWYVSANILCDDQEQATRAVEATSRMAVGLALDGLTVSISVSPMPPDEPER